MPAFSRNELLAMAHRKAAGQMQHGELKATAEKLGISPSAVSQALSSIEESSAAQTSAQANQANLHDNKYDALELVALNKLEGLLAVETNIMKVSKIMEMLNSAKRRAGIVGSLGSSSASGSANFITINMPAAIQQKLVLNENKEVIEVDGRSLVTMPSTEVEKILQEKKEAQAAAQELEAKEVAARIAAKEVARAEKDKSLMELLGEGENSPSPKAEAEHLSEAEEKLTSKQSSDENQFSLKI